MPNEVTESKEYKEVKDSKESEEFKDSLDSFSSALFPWIPQGFRIRKIQALLKESNEFLNSSDSLKYLTSLYSLDSVTSFGIVNSQF